MASKPLSRLKVLLKLVKFKRIKPPINPQPELASKAPPTSSSAEAPPSAANIPDVDTAMLEESYLSQSKAPTTSKALAPTSSTDTPTPIPASNISEAGTIISGTSEVNQSKVAKISLWERAYDTLKEKNEKLVKEYEHLLSKELPTGTNTKSDIHSDESRRIPLTEQDSTDEQYNETENQIEGDNRKIRLEQLETITSNGLQQLDEKKAKYNIFGHEFALRDQLAQATRFIQAIKDVIDDAVRVSPEASVAWAGVCVILPIFMNPSAAEEASRDGCLYVTSRIRFYVKLESLLLASNKQQDCGIHVELENRLIDLYQLIIDFQIRTVRRVYLTRLARLKEDTIRHEDWKGMIAKIQEAEKMFSDDFKLLKDAATRKALDGLNSDAEKLVTQVDSMLASLLKANRDALTFSFHNVGSGSQLNATGGTQNNAIGNGKQFIGATFSGAVHFT